MVPWGLGLGKRRELFRSRRTLRALPSPLYFFVFDKNASGGPKPAAFSLKKTAYLHFLAVALSAAKAGAAKATARPRVTETSVFMFSLHRCYRTVGRERLAAAAAR